MLSVDLFINFTGNEPVVKPLKKFIGASQGKNIYEMCTVTNSAQHTITYTRVDGRSLPAHQILPNGIVMKYNSVNDTGEYHCEAQTDKGLHTASFFGRLNQGL